MNNYYNQVDTTTIKPKGFKYIPAGIQDDTRIIDITWGTTPFNVDFIEIKYEKDGMTGTTTEREASQGALSTEEFMEKVKNQLSRIERIAGAINGIENTDPTKITNEGQISIPRFAAANAGGSFEDVFKWLYSIWKSKSIDQDYRIKFIYPENSRFVTTPKYLGWEWIEPMALVNADKSKIAKLNFESFTLPTIQADIEPQVSNTLANSTAMNDVTSTDELPF